MATNGHGLIFTSHSHQKLKEKDRQVQRRATEYSLDGNGGDNMDKWVWWVERAKTDREKNKRSAACSNNHTCEEPQPK